MPQETIVYLVNLIIGAILATLLSYHWRRGGATGAMGYWVVGAWVMTVADIFFAARPELPHWVARLVPTLLVTVGHAVLLLGAQKTADRPSRMPLAIALVALHAVILVAFLVTEIPSQWRMVGNGLIWGGLSLGCFLALRRAPAPFHNSPVSPAAVFLLHACFHAARLSLATLFALQGWTTAAQALQIIGDLEVSFFTVALFVSLLIAHLQVRHDELSRALTEVKTLTDLLPICAWCRKVRDDEGYWQQIEDYFESQRQVKFTHGICSDCARDQFGPTATRVK